MEPKVRPYQMSSVMATQRIMYSLPEIEKKNMAKLRPSQRV
jgi:hypothetical protein